MCSQVMSAQLNAVVPEQQGMAILAKNSSQAKSPAIPETDMLTGCYGDRCADSRPSHNVSVNGQEVRLQSTCDSETNGRGGSFLRDQSRDRTWLDRDIPNSSGMCACSSGASSNSSPQQTQTTFSSGVYTCNSAVSPSWLSQQTAMPSVRSYGVSTSGSSSTQPSQPNLPISSTGAYTCTSTGNLSSFTHHAQVNFPITGVYASGSNTLLCAQPFELAFQVRPSGPCTSGNTTRTPKPVPIAPKNWRQEPISSIDTQTNVQWSPVFDSALNGLMNAAPAATMGSSPSSDYGSYVSDLGTGLNGASVELFDGPFRVPYPLSQECGRNGQAPRKSVAAQRRGSLGESSSTSSSSQNSFQDIGSAQQHQSSANSLSLTTSSTDSDAGVDMTDLQGLPSFEFDLLDSELCLDLPECVGDSFTDAGDLSAEKTSICSPLPQDTHFLEGNQGDLLFQSQHQSRDASLAPSHDLSVNSVSSATTKEGTTFSDTPLLFHSAVTRPPMAATPLAFPEPSQAVGMTSCYTTGLSTQSCDPRAPLASAVETPHTTVAQGMRDVTMIGMRASSCQPELSKTIGQPPVYKRFSAQGLCGDSLPYQPQGADVTQDVSGNPNDTQRSPRSQEQPLAPRSPGQFVPVSARIIEYSPEWSYPEGGVKVLVTGEWSVTQGTFTCLFDGCSVHATLIHPGVLRCFCPSHEPGLVTLQVACNGFIVSNACVFEYRTRDSPTANGAAYHEWLAKDETRFKLAVLDRLERLEARLFSSTTTFTDAGQTQQSLKFEERLVNICTALFSAANSEETSSRDGGKPYRGLTLLHLSAALGYSSLVCRLLQCRRETKSEIIKEELMALKRDDFSCTPLMWACALGHKDTVMVLLEHEPNALLLADARGRLPLQIARDRGYIDLVNCIEEFVMASSERFVNLCCV